MYLSFVIMLSLSSSISFSAAAMSSSIWDFCISEMPSVSYTLLSRSNNFIAYHRCCSSEISCSTAFSMLSITCSTLPQNLCLGAVFSIDFAASSAAAEASFMPVPFNAEISTTLQPSSAASCAVFILSPFL